MRPGADVSDRMGDAHKETSAPDVAVIITLAERGTHVEKVYDECRTAFEDAPYRVEFIVAAEPWARHLLDPLRDERASGGHLRLLIAGQPVGESALLRSAVATTEAPVIVTLPSYPRVQGSAVPRLVEEVAEGADMAVARRWPRNDSFVNRLQSRLFNSLLRTLTGSRFSDVACGVRALKRSVLEDVPLYGDFGRFLPVMASRYGYRVVEVPAKQHVLDRAARVYSPGTYVRRMIDVLGLFFLTRFTEKPLRFFGLLGGVTAAVGAVLLVVLVVQRLGGQGMADRPLLLLALLLLVLGSQAIALGLVGEIIVHLHSARRKPYRLSDAESLSQVDEHRPDPPAT